jgi:hypothetical protein
VPWEDKIAVERLGNHLLYTQCESWSSDNPKRGLEGEGRSMENKKKTQDDTDEDRFGHLRGFDHFKAGMLSFCIKVIKGRVYYALLLTSTVFQAILPEE